MRVSDAELLKSIEELSHRWFSAGLADIPLEKKMRLLPYVVRTRKTSAAQLSRIFGFKREVTEEAMRTLMKKQ